MCAGPPCMNSEIIARAFVSPGGCFGVKSNDCGLSFTVGGTASSFSWFSSQASATPPIPSVPFASSSRRVGRKRNVLSGIVDSSIDVQKLVGTKQCLAQIGQSLQFGIGIGRGCRQARELLAEESAHGGELGGRDRTVIRNL